MSMFSWSTVAGNARPQQCARCEQRRPKRKQRDSFGNSHLGNQVSETAKSLLACKAAPRLFSNQQWLLKRRGVPQEVNSNIHPR